MVNVDKAQIAKYRAGPNHFEILVDGNLAIELRQGKSVSISDVLAIPKIFKDAKKGLEASPAIMKQVFNTDDPIEVSKIIIQKGDVPATADYRNKVKEEKRKQLIAFLHRNVVDPKTHLPHPPMRIENAFEEAKFHVDGDMEFNKLVEEALKKIRPILPVKFETKEIAIKIPPDYAAKSYTLVHSFGKVLQEEWLRDGSWAVVLEIPGGMEEEMHNKLNALCHGNVETKILNIK